MKINLRNRTLESQKILFLEMTISSNESVWQLQNNRSLFSKSIRDPKAKNKKKWPLLPDVYKLSNMLRFNFDSEFFRRVISRSDSAERVPSLSQLLKEAIDSFYDEFDYYPEMGVYAPGVFTILGDHMEYVEGKLVQAALPYGTLIVGKSMNTVKCKVITTAKHVDGLKKTVFPVTYFSNSKTPVYPTWVAYLRGVLNCFPCKDLKGFDALIHSSIPTNKGFGSSAALQVAFYTFLQATCKNTCCGSVEKRGKICRDAEMKFQTDENPVKMGLWSSVTSSVAEQNSGLLINCRKDYFSFFDMREINILFLLTYPNFEIELNDRECVPRREMELYLIARLLGLNHIREATEKHLKIFEQLEDPTRETVIEILRGLGKDEDDIFEFVEELFYFPVSEADFEMYGEGNLYEVDIGEASTKTGDDTHLRAEDDFDKKYATPCFPRGGGRKWIKETIAQKKSSYMQNLLAQLCAGKTIKEKLIKTEKICEEINCLGGLENLSEASDVSVIAKLLRRLRHVITEKMRVDSLPDIIERGDYVEFGTLLIQSHLSFKLDYEISCPSLDNLVQLAIDTDDVYGAKMMSGGGTLTLLHRSVADGFIQRIKDELGDNYQFHLVFPESGARKIDIGVKSNPQSCLSVRYLNKTEFMRKAVYGFETTYKYRPTHGAYSPGVLNIIGDHADYNHGLTISMAVSLLTMVVGAFNGTSKVRIATTNDTEGEPRKVIFPLPSDEDITPGRIKWVKLLRGVICHFEGPLRGFDCLIESNIPSGSGISSQAVMVSAFYTFLEVLTDQKSKDSCKKAYKCMYVQQDFANFTCGMGDPTVSIRAREDYAVFLDCRSLTSTLLPFQDTSVNLVMSFTDQKATDVRRLLYSRMEDCYKVAKALGGKTLRCLTLRQLDAMDSKKVPESALRRAKHVVLENERVLRAAEALKNNDFESLGELMVASHNSLRYNFEVTTPELDFLVERAMEVDGVLGSKMACSGNSSCMITLVKRWAVDDLIEYLQINFSEKLDSYVVTSYDGCGPLSVKELVDTLPSPQFVFEDIFPY